MRVSGGHLCEAEATDRAGRRDRRKVRGNPFFLFRVLRILSRSALRMTYNSIIANTYGVRLYFCLPVIAVWVSGGHLCEAEATDRAGRRDHRKVRSNPFSLLPRHCEAV